MAVFCGCGPRRGKLPAPRGVGVAGPARDERGRLVVEVGPEVRPALPGRDGVPPRATRRDRGGNWNGLRRPRRGVDQFRIADARRASRSKEFGTWWRQTCGIAIR